MTLTLHYHPLSSYCWKALIALYETGAPFEPVLLNLGDPVERAAHLARWPMGKMPVLTDEARGETVPEASVIVDYLDRYYPGPTPLTPTDPDQAWRTRLWDRFFDLHVHNAMQRIVADRIRPAGQQDPFGLAEARAQLATALASSRMRGALADLVLRSRVRPRRLRGRAGALLRQPRAALRRRSRRRPRLPGPPAGAPVVRPRAEGSRALLRDVPGGLADAAATNRLAALRWAAHASIFTAPTSHETFHGARHRRRLH